MPKVELTHPEWQQVISLIANGPWHMANPLLMKIGDQLRAQQANSVPAPPSHVDEEIFKQ